MYLVRRHPHVIVSLAVCDETLVEHFWFARCCELCSLTDRNGSYYS